jgi:hypothetical protein
MSDARCFHESRPARIGRARRRLELAGRPGVTGRFVSETIVVTSVLVVYDGSANLRLLDVAAIVLGLPIAIAIGHMLAWSLSHEAALGRRRTRGELLSTVRRESRFLLVAAPQIVVLSLAGLSLNDVVQVLIWAGAASLGFWGGVAALRAGLGGRGIALGVLMGFAVGGVVLLFQVLGFLRRRCRHDAIQPHLLRPANRLRSGEASRPRSVASPPC